MPLTQATEGEAPVSVGEAALRLMCAGGNLLVMHYVSCGPTCEKQIDVI